MRGKDAIVCDDDPMVRRIVVAVLQRCGYRSIETTSSAQEAVSLAEAMQPAVIVLDLSLEDESGIDAIPQLKELSPGSAIVVYSGADAMKDAARSEGASAVIDKVSLTSIENLEQAIRALE